MTDRCEPPEELRGVDGWHWVQHGSVAPPTMASWEMPEWWPETGGAWRIGSHLYMPKPAHQKGWRYLAPVTPPAEVEALRAELERERMRLAACGVVALSDTPASAQRNRDMLPEYRSASCDDVARRVDECMALRATVAQMRAALEPFSRATVLPSGDVVGMERHWFERARAALAAAKEAGG